MTYALHLSRLTLYTPYTVLVTFLVTSALLSATGSGDLRGPDDDPVMLFVGEETFGNFAVYDGPEASRLNFRIHSAGETVYFGLARQYRSSGVPETFGEYRYRVRSVATGEVVFGPHVVNVTNENLSSYAQAVIGPEALTAGGYPNPNEFTFVAPQAGDYYVEFDPGLRGAPRYIGLWDITVANNGVEQVGRVYSKNWAFRVPKVEPNQPYCAFGAELNTEFYSYTADGFVTKIDFTDSGFQPLSFNLAFNRTGPGTSGDLSVDRQSVPFVNATDNAAEHLIFLEEPDPLLFPDGVCGQANLSGPLRCTGGNEFCIPVTATQAGQVDILLDFNQNGRFDEGMDRILVYAAEAGNLEGCVPWDGLRGDGSAPPQGALVDLKLSFSQGVQHWSLYDGELMRNGFCVTPIRPACSVADNTPLFYDDINIVEDPGTGGPQRQLEGCECRTENCRTWVNFEANAGDNCRIVDSRTTGYGDRNTLNTWWFAYAVQSNTLDIPITMSSIEGPQDHCPGEPVVVTLNINTSNEIGTIDWSGPDGNLPALTNQLEITVNQRGIYTATVTDDVGCSSTNTYMLADVSCSLRVNVLSVSCDDAGTQTNPNDDVFYVDVRVDGNNSQDFTYGGERYAYGEAFQIGPFPISSGEVIFTATDGFYACCTESVVIPAPRPCSDGCAITEVNIIDTECSSNGTLTDPDDDTFVFTMVVNGINTGARWEDAAAGWSGEYGAVNTFGPFPISEGDRNYYFQDVNDGDCAIAVTIQPPPPCSDDCLIVPVASNVTCDDNDTPYDATDDLYYFDLTVTGTNTPSVAYTVDESGAYRYGTTNRFGPYPIATDDLSFSIVDLGGAACNVTFTLPERPEGCSSACGISVDDVIVTCVEDPTTGREELQIEALVTNLNPNSQGWLASTGGSGQYGQYTVVSTINPGGETLRFTVAEMERADCVATGEATSGAISVTCPENVLTLPREVTVQQFGGRLVPGTNDLSPEAAPCYLPRGATSPGTRYQDRMDLVFRDDQLNLPRPVTFYLYARPGARLASNVFSIDLQEDLDCKAWTTGSPQGAPGTDHGLPDLPGGVIPEGLTLKSSFTAVMLPNQRYSLVTTNLIENVEEDFYYLAILANTPLLTLRGADGAAVTGDTAVINLPFVLSPFAARQIINDMATTDTLGLPTSDETCGSPSFALRDNLLGTCESAHILRTFDLVIGDTTLRDVCTQTISVSAPALPSVLWPEARRRFACDETYPTLLNGNPAPSYTGYPFIYRDGMALALTEGSEPNLMATFTDRDSLLADGGTLIERTWAVEDLCRGGVATFTQEFCTGAGGQAFFTCPISNHYCPIVEEDIMVWRMDSFECSATIELPEPELNNLCDTTGWEFLTQVFVLIDGDTNLIAQLVNDDERVLRDLPAGDYLLYFSGAHADETVTPQYCRFRVEDVESPVAACKSFVRVSLPSNGLVQVPARLIDQGSYDNCPGTSISVRRDSSLTGAFGPGLIFDCEDTDTEHPVTLRIVDAGGNENFCTSTVAVLDNTNPRCTGLSTLNLTCAELPDGFSAYDTIDLRLAFGMPDVVDNCDALARELPPEVFGDACTPERIRRGFTAIDRNGNVSSEVFYQDIFIAPTVGYAIAFPEDATVECLAEAPGVTLFGSGCDSLTVEVEEATTPAEDGFCVTVERRFTVTNWCEWDGTAAAIPIGRAEYCLAGEGAQPVYVVRTAEGAFVDVDGDVTNASPGADDCTGISPGYLRQLPTAGGGRYTYTQVIRIADDTPPAFTVSMLDTICAIADQCQAEVTVNVALLDTCQFGDSQLSVRVDYDNDGNFEVTSDEAGILTAGDNGYSYRVVLPLGIHQVEMALVDACGNRTATNEVFTVNDCYVPELTPRQYVTYELASLPDEFDVDGDGVTEEATALVSAVELASCDFPDCSGSLRFSVNRVGEAPNPEASSFFLDCNDRYRIELEVYVWDRANNPFAVQPDGTVGGPNWKMETVTVRVSDPTLACTNCQVDEFLTLNGTVTTPAGTQLGGVRVAAKDGGDVTTDRFGNWQLPGQVDDSFLLSATLNDAPRSGLTVLDLVILHRHLLRMEQIEDPYLRLAADLDGDGSINVLDLLHLQGLILGRLEYYPEHSGWRFIDAAWDGSGTPNELIDLRNVPGCSSGHDFIGIKSGDLNMSGRIGAGIVERQRLTQAQNE